MVYMRALWNIPYFRSTHQSMGKGCMMHYQFFNICGHLIKSTVVLINVILALSRPDLNACFFVNNVSKRNMLSSTRLLHTQSGFLSLK